MSLFNLFKSKSPIEKLQKEYKKLLLESNKLSTIDRAQSDLKFSQAQEVNNKIDALLKQPQNK